LHHFFSVSLFSLRKWDHKFIKSNKKNYTRWSENGYLKRQKRFNWKTKKAQWSGREKINWWCKQNKNQKEIGAVSRKDEGAKRWI
jgi:hypothetical protein